MKVVVLCSAQPSLHRPVPHLEAVSVFALPSVKADCTRLGSMMVVMVNNHIGSWSGDMFVLTASLNGLFFDLLLVIFGIRANSQGGLPEH